MPLAVGLEDQRLDHDGRPGGICSAVEDEPVGSLDIPVHQDLGGRTQGDVRTRVQAPDGAVDLQILIPADHHLARCGRCAEGSVAGGIGRDGAQAVDREGHPRVAAAQIEVHPARGPDRAAPGDQASALVHARAAHGEGILRFDVHHGPLPGPGHVSVTIHRGPGEHRPHDLHITRRDAHRALVGGAGHLHPRAHLHQVTGLDLDQPVGTERRPPLYKAALAVRFPLADPDRVVRLNRQALPLAIGRQGHAVDHHFLVGRNPHGTGQVRVPVDRGRPVDVDLHLVVIQGRRGLATPEHTGHVNIMPNQPDLGPGLDPARLGLDGEGPGRGTDLDEVQIGVEPADAAVDGDIVEARDPDLTAPAQGFELAGAAGPDGDLSFALLAARGDDDVVLGLEAAVEGQRAVRVDDHVRA